MCKHAELFSNFPMCKNPEHCVQYPERRQVEIAQVLLASALWGGLPSAEGHGRLGADSLEAAFPTTPMRPHLGVASAALNSQLLAREKGPQHDYREFLPWIVVCVIFFV